MNTMDNPPQTIPGTFAPTVKKSFQLKGDVALSLAMHQGDFDGTVALLDLILLLEPLNHVDLVLSIAGGTDALPEREWYDFHSKAVGFFRSVKINRVRDIRPAYMPTEGNQSRDWRPNNNMFRGVADFFQHFSSASGAFFYLEPDCAILKRDWFSQMSSQYQLGRKPFMGVIRQAHTTSGSALPRHMNGCGFYPNPVVNFSQALYVASTNQHAEAAPFDVAGGSTVVPLCQSTKLICVDFTANPLINPEAVLWHGDKKNQMKFSMIEKFGGIPSVVTAVKEPDRILFPETLTMEILKMPERIVTSVPIPANAYEAYLEALISFGHDRAAWMRAVKTFKGNAQKKTVDTEVPVA